MSSYLRYNTCISILHAVDYAKKLGYPLNLFVTVLIDTQNCKNKPSKIFSLINRAKNRWLSEYYKKNHKQHIQPLGVHVFENPRNHMHFHWMLYIPNELITVFEKKLCKWLERYQGFIQEKSIDIKAVNPHLDKILANYMIKGVDPIHASRLSAFRGKNYQGEIYGQRARASRALNKKARQKAGFDASKHRHEWMDDFPEIANSFSKPDNWTLEKIIPQEMGKNDFNKDEDY